MQRRLGISLIILAATVVVATTYSITRFVQVQSSSEQATLKASVSQAFRQASQVKTAVAEFFVDRGRMPASLQEVGLQPAAPPYANGEVSIVSAGVVALTLPPQPASKARHLYLAPTVASTKISWMCISPDITSIASIAPGCRYVAGYAPSTVTAKELEAKLQSSGTVTVKTAMRDFTFTPQYLISDNPVSLKIEGITELSAVDRAAVIAGAARSVTGRLYTLDDLLNYASWLQTGGPDFRAPLEQQLATQAPEVAAAALLALCEFNRPQMQTDAFSACLLTPRPGSGPAIDSIVALATKSLKNPTRIFMGTAGKIVSCTDAAALLGALSTHARPGIDALGSLLNDTRPQLIAGDIDVCPHRLVAVALLKILLTPPQDTTHTTLRDQAVLTLIETTLLMGNRAFLQAPPSPQLAKLLDSQPLQASLGQRINQMVTRWVQVCSNVGRYDSPLASDLGKIGFFTTDIWLDRLTDGKCDIYAQIQLVQIYVAKYPEMTGIRYAEAQSIYTRDDILAAAINLLQDSDADANQPAPNYHALHTFLDVIGYVPVTLQGTTVVFPKQSGLHWVPLPSWSIRVKLAPGAANTDLSAAYANLVKSNPDCTFPAKAESVWRSVESAKRLFVFPCGQQHPSTPADEEDPIVVIGSPDGFKKMRFPERLEIVLQEDQQPFAGVGDSDGDGNLEVLTLIPCDGRDYACADGTEKGSFVFFEEDGDWFTWFLAPHTK